MDNEECCDWYPWVEPVEDYNAELEGWASRGDYWLEAYAEASRDRNRWRNIADDWQHAAEYAMDTARLGLWILIAVGAVATILIIVKVLQ